MSGTVPSASLLESQVAEIRRRQKERKAIGFHLSAPWNGPLVIQVDGEEVPVAFCPSVLAFRARLAESESAPVQPVLLTDRNASELGQDVLARLTKRTLFRLDAWDALRERFGVREIDRRLRERGYEWLPAHLLAIPPGEIVKPATGFLDLDEVWQLLLSRLGFSNPSPDLRDLLEWTTRPDGLATLAQLAPDVRDAHLRRLAQSSLDSAHVSEPSETAGAAILHLVSAGRGREAVAAGLVCEVLFPTGGLADLDQSRAVGRFEAALLNRSTLSPAAGRAWAIAAGALTRQRLERDGRAGIAPWLSQAGELLAELNVQSLGERSSWLQAGFDRAAATFVEALSTWLERQDAARMPDLAAAGRAVSNHGLSRVWQAEASAVDDMLRLARWLAGRKGKTEAGSFPEAASAYTVDGSWVDRARTALADAPLAGALAAARDRLLQAVLDRREAENRRFAELLAKWSATGAAAGPLIPVEAILDRVVAPLADAGPVLLLILDGMSFAVYRELTAGLAQRGWEEQRPADAPAGLFGVGLLPTVTHVCRASLLSGRPQTGDASVEAQAFASNPGLRQRSSASQAPVLFHKKHLAGDGAGLSDKVLDEVKHKGRRVVGVVLNVVDDQLPKGHQLLARWETSAIRYLETLLQAAADAGRTVVLTADHGHVIERKTELRRAEGAGARYRPSGPGSPPPQDGEVAVRGPRVLLGEGLGLILAWSEGHRYTALQSGYHGGASPQEVVVPLAVWSAAGAGAPGWQSAGEDEPAWWRGEAIPVVREAPKPKTKAAPAPKTQPTLFDMPAGPEPWLADLFASPVYREQQSRTSRQPLTDAEVGAVLVALAERGGGMTLTALARQRGISVLRAQGLVAALQRLLNVEGYPVLSLDPVSETVSLDRELLKTQFPRAEEAEA